MEKLNGHHRPESESHSMQLLDKRHRLDRVVIFSANSAISSAVEKAVRDTAPGSPMVQRFEYDGSNPGSIHGNEQGVVDELLLALDSDENIMVIADSVAARREYVFEIVAGLEEHTGKNVRRVEVVSGTKPARNEGVYRLRFPAETAHARHDLGQRFAKVFGEVA